MTGRGWSAEDLPLVGRDDTLWTVEEAVFFLGAHVSLKRVRKLAGDRLEPVGKRRMAPSGKGGRCARVYAASDFIQLYESLAQAA
jgi:hypothetical protein